MEKSESIVNLAKALLKFNAECTKIGKGSINPFFKNKYAALPDILDTIKEPLQNSGLIVKQFPEGENELITIIIHADSGEFMSSKYSMKAIKSDPQSEGSRITYQRRYALGAVLGLNIDEDDDGNKATTPPKKEEPKKETDQRPIITEAKMTELLNLISSGFIDNATTEAKKFRIMAENSTKLNNAVIEYNKLNTKK
jgi:hypothetical protein